MGIKHDTVGTQLTQTEWEAADSHHITDLIPEADDTYDLGSASLNWQDLFLKGNIALTNAGTISTTAGALTITSAAAATWSTGAGALTLTSAAALNLNPTAGSAIVLDGTINVDAGVVTGATSITSTAFVGDITGTASTATVATTVTITDNESTNESNAIIFTAGGDVDGGNLGLESDGTLTYNPSTGKITATGFIGALTGNADTATVATTVTITDNESTNETNAVVFTSGGDVDGGNIGLESDGTLNYNPSSGTLTTTAFAGNITGTLTGNATGTAATVTGGTQTAITTLANLTTSGALNAGSITSGFGNIDNGSSTLDTGALDASTGTFSGVLKTDDTTNATSTTDGSLQTDGGLSVALDAIFGDDVTLITDSAVLNLGVGSDVSITHDGATGGTITGTPMVYESKGSATLANDKHSGVVLEMLAGESIAVGDWVYADSTDGRVSKADAYDTGDNGHYPAIGVSVSAQGSAGSAVKILTHGVYNDSDGFGGSDLTEGNVLYLSETAGGVTATAPSDDGDIVQVCGIAIGPRDVFVNPSLDMIEHD